MNVRAIADRARGHWKQVLVVALLVVAGLGFLRDCIPGLGGGLPPALYDESQRRYVTCIGVDETPIWPGEPRQPTCGDVNLAFVGRGMVPPEAQASGVTRAVCYRVTYSNPYWTTQGATRHEIVSHGRTLSKVAVYQDGVWQTFPDRDDLDEQRWISYRCPGEYENRANERGE